VAVGNGQIARDHDHNVARSAQTRKSPAEAFAYFTGGNVYSFAREKALALAITDIGKDLRSQYLLSYSPNDKDEPGFHTIKVSVDRPGLKIRTRPSLVPVARGASCPYSSVSSKGTTASAPLGIGAPVMIRTADRG